MHLTFQPRSLILFKKPIYYNIVFSQTICPIELKFHVKTPYDKLAKIYAKYFGHKTKMTVTPIYGKSPYKIFFGDLGTWYVALGMWNLPSLFK